MSNFADLSHHQDSLNVSVYSTQRKVIALKATEGTGFTDPTFKTRWGACKGLRRIAYHYAKPKFNGADEFDHCWSVVKAAGFDPHNDIIALDVEDPDVPTRAAANAAEFVKAAVAAGLDRGLVYTYPNYAKVNGITPSLFPVGWRRLWFANYSSTPDAQLTLPPGWSRDQWYARQFTSTATIPGVSGTNTDDSRILKDWLAPIITPGGTTVALDPELKSYLDAQFAKIATGEGTILRGDDPDPATGDTHPKNIGTIYDEVVEMHQHLMDFINTLQSPSMPAPTPPTA